MALGSCSHRGGETLASPDGEIKVEFALDGEGTPTYAVKFHGKDIVEKSRLGFATLNDSLNFRSGFKVDSVVAGSFHEVWASDMCSPSRLSTRCSLPRSFRSSPWART